MKLKILALAFALVGLVSFTVAEDIKSGLKVGEDIVHSTSPSWLALKKMVPQLASNCAIVARTVHVHKS